MVGLLGCTWWKQFLARLGSAWWSHPCKKPPLLHHTGCKGLAGGIVQCLGGQVVAVGHNRKLDYSVFTWRRDLSQRRVKVFKEPCKLFALQDSIICLFWVSIRKSHFPSSAASHLWAVSIQRAEESVWALDTAANISHWVLKYFAHK